MRTKTRWLTAAGIAIAACLLALLLGGDGTENVAPPPSDEQHAERTPPPLLETRESPPPVEETGENEEQDAAEPTAEAAPETVQVVVRDAFDGSILKGLTVLSGTTSLGSVVRRVRFIEEPGWSVLQEASDGDVVWVYRTVRCHVRVRADRGVFSDIPDPMFVFMDSNHWESKRPAGMGDKWFSAVQQTQKPGTVPPFYPIRGDGRVYDFEARLPRILGVLVQVQAPGFMDAATLLDPPADHELSIHAELTLRRAPLIAGRVLDEVGKPVEGARLLVRVDVPYPEDDDESDTLMWSVRGWSCTGAGGNADPHMRFEHEFTPDPKTGAFRVHLPIEGKLLLHARAVGCEPVKVEYGTTGRDRAGLDLTLTRLRGPVRTHAILVDLFDKKVHPIALWKKEGTAITDIIQVRVGPHGRIPVKDLERGMEYLVKDMTKGKFDDWDFMGKFVWEEQSQIVLRPAR